MSRIWTEEGKLERWLDVELAALDAWAELGVVPAADVAAIRERATASTSNGSRRSSGRTDHDLAAFVDTVAEQVGAEARWFHYGLTSSDVRRHGAGPPDAGRRALLLAGVERAIAAVIRRAVEHRRTSAWGARTGSTPSRRRSG